MKWCSTCQSHKEDSEFNKNKGRKDGLNSICRPCSNNRSRKYYAENGDFHKKYIVKQNRRRRKTNKIIVDEYKSLHPCIICGETEICCLDFHHVGEKKDAVSKLISGGVSLEVLMEEIHKCVVLCASCHRKVHAGLIDCRVG